MGKVIFKKCSICHDVGKEGRNRFGPWLYNLFGSVGGTVPGYYFSRAMKNAQIVWTTENLSAHTKDPQAFTPGTTMPNPGPMTDKERLDLIAYLRQATAIDPANGVEAYDLRQGVFFNDHIHNILDHYCGECHGHRTPLPASKLRGALLETYDEITRDSINGRLVIPGDVEHSILVNFLDGSKHFVTLSKLEKDLVKRWIQGGALKGSSDLSSKRRLLAYNVNKNEANHIYCLVGDGVVFARLDVIDQDSGKIYYTDWFHSNERQWLHWTIPAIRPWPDRVAVTLTLTGDDNTLALEDSDKTSTLFAANDLELTDYLLENYAKKARFEWNPIHSGADKFGSFHYYLYHASDVLIQIYRSELGSSPVKEINEPNVQSGERSKRWDFDGLNLQPGDYTAALHLKSRDTKWAQPSYMVLVHVQ